jgi:glutamate:GABA antiporter
VENKNGMEESHPSSTRKPLGTFALVMINVIAIDSIRTLAIGAQFGASLVFFYLIAAIFFMIPSGLVSAELTAFLPKRGGLYVWVREAFGKQFAFVIIWLNWIYNVFWYPTILVLIAGTFSYLFNPELASNKLFIALFTLTAFWIMTLANCWGMRISSYVSTFSALIGTLFPMLAIVILGSIFFTTSSSYSLDFSHFIPKESTFENNLGFFDNILFGLMGLEMSATHAKEMRDPAKHYPRSVFITIAIVISTTIAASLAVAIIIPNKEISLATGVIEAFTLFLKTFHLSWMLPIFVIGIMIGGLGGVASWIIGPTKGLLVAARDGSLPYFLKKVNKHGVPTRLLILQALIVSFLCLVFTIMPTVTSSFWVLSAICAQLALIVYIVLFSSAIALRPRMNLEDSLYRIPGGSWGLNLCAFSGITICLISFFFGFILPRTIHLNKVYLFEALLFGGCILMILIPILVGYFSRRAHEHGK